ncbi:MAG: tRNA dihydrouridine synthase DusB [Chitinophagales bacterium]|jgi:nifR3 family TIM-barrel protein|nr:tRNA dihydrouridine synthase DusB [Chitinophagales bacterium]
MVRIGTIELGDFPLLLAPMEDVSDPPFRAVCKLNGADLMYTEFISSEGLIRNAKKSVQKLDIYEEERPIGIQFFGGEIDTMVNCVDIIEEAGPDLIDINFGCPVKGVACRGAGAGILKDVPKMVKMTAEIVKRATLPVTVKTRLGWDEDSVNIFEVAERLQDIGIAALSIHGRTRAQMYKGSARWEPIAAVKNNPRMRIPIFLNGDITTPEKVKFIYDNYGVDGVMIGRAAIGNPWFFNEVKHFLYTGEHLPSPAIEERLHVSRTHLAKSIKWKEGRLGILEMRKHYSSYFKGLPNVKEFRDRLVRLEDADEIELVFLEMEEYYSIAV